MVDMVVGRRVAVVSLGGTIAMVPRPGSGTAVVTLTAAELVGAVPGLSDAGIDVDVVDLRRLPGASVTPADLRQVVATARAAVGHGAAGVVVTQGTDTIEETAFLLDLMWTADEPLVVTGAMRHPAMAGADGPANLLAAVRVATTPQARGLGCVVVMADEIHAAQWVRKTHTTSVAAFASPTVGPLGYVVEGVMRLHTRPAVERLRLPAAADIDHDVPVALLTIGLGDDGELLRRVSDPFRGAVVAAFGVGHVPATLVDPLAELAADMPVVIASRIGVGPVLANTYGFAGSESDLLDRGLIGAGFLDPYKARILLQALLSTGADRTDIAAAFSRTSRVLSPWSRSG